MVRVLKINPSQFDPYGRRQNTGEKTETSEIAEGGQGRPFRIGSHRVTPAGVLRATSRIPLTIRQQIC